MNKETKRRDQEQGETAWVSRTRITKGDGGGWVTGCTTLGRETRKLNWQAQVALKPDYPSLLLNYSLSTPSFLILRPISNLTFPVGRIRGRIEANQPPNEPTNESNERSFSFAWRAWRNERANEETIEFERNGCGRVKLESRAKWNERESYTTYGFAIPFPLLLSLVTHVPEYNHPLSWLGLIREGIGFGLSTE